MRVAAARTLHDTKPAVSPFSLRQRWRNHMTANATGSTPGQLRKRPTTYKVSRSEMVVFREQVALNARGAGAFFPGAGLPVTHQTLYLAGL